MDHGATTPVDKEVMKEMLPYFDIKFGNASSIHCFGKETFNAIENAREKVAKLINCNAEEIFFTSGGTESDNLAIKGIAYKNKEKIGKKGYHIITSSIEHPAVLETCKYMQELGYNVKFLPVDKFGIIDLNELKKSISKNTFLVSIMFANHEIGTLQPIKEITKITQENNILFHTDAVQAVCKTPVDVKKQKIDLLSLSGHKIYAPKGVGALYIKKGIRPQTISHGGGHEKGVRSSTYNSPGIVGLGKACELGKERLLNDMKKLKILRDNLIKNTLKIEESYLNGHPDKRLVNNAHFRFTAVEGESLNLRLDNKGIAVATGSACSSKKLEPSHILLAMGLKAEEAHGSLRFTLGRMNTQEDVDYINNTLPEIVGTLRKMSPLWDR